MFVVLETYRNSKEFYGNVTVSIRPSAVFFNTIEEALEFASRNGAEKRQVSGRCLASFHDYSMNRQADVFEAVVGAKPVQGLAQKVYKN